MIRWFHGQVLEIISSYFLTIKEAFSIMEDTGSALKHTVCSMQAM